MSTSITNKYYPSLSTVVTLDDFPDNLGFIKEGIKEIFDNIYIKDFQANISPRGESGFYGLSIVSKERLQFKIPGTEILFVLNPDKDDASISSFPVTVEYQWLVLSYLRSFDLQNFSFSARDFFELGLQILNVSEEEVISLVINNFVAPSNDSLTKVEQFDTPTEAYAALKKEYIHICTGRAFTVPYDNDYFVPYLNLYPETTNESLFGPSEIPLTAKIRNHSQDTPALQYTLEYDSSLFTITHDPIPTTGNHDVYFNIKCLKEFNTDQIIKVIVHTQSNANDYISQNIAGALKVCKNSKQENRKKLKIVLVKVKTNKNNDPLSSGETGLFNESTYFDEEIYLKKVLYQNLIYADIEGPIELDLTEDPLFHVDGGYIYTDGNIKAIVDPFNVFDPLDDDADDKKQDYLKLKLYNDKIENQKYKNYFPIFSFDITAKLDDGEQIAGNAQLVGKHSVCLYPERNNTTLAHEVLHGLGLWHTHSSNITDSDHKYTFPKGNSGQPIPNATDNIMSYNGALRKTTWHWQWKILQSLLNK